ncbi:MAG: DUF1080 domain-containing protein [Phycisphaerales bacterium]|nr:MAG: DUF1080 domain-containing protein [Phycisphaerales bacterium]
MRPLTKTHSLAAPCVLFVAVFLLLSCHPADPCPCPHPHPCPCNENSSGTGPWQNLFNGSDLGGWTVKCKPADRDKEFWRADDGAILADSMAGKGHDYVWLVSDRQYSDFILHLRFQAFRDSPGNSGVQIRSRYDDRAGWLDGPQIDINPPGPWRTGMIWDETRGSGRWLWPAVPKGQWVNESMANPELLFYFSDEEPAWNDLEITAIGTKITAVLNGAKITDYDGAGVLDDEVHQRRNVGMTGHIALQIHRGDRLKIRFKDIYIRDLSR